MVRAGQRVHKGQLLARLDNPESASELGQIEAETQALSARSARLAEEGRLASTACAGTDCADEAQLRAVRESALRSRVAALHATADQAPPRSRRSRSHHQQPAGQPGAGPEAGRDAGAAGGEEYRPANRLLDARREVIDLQGRIAAAREQQGQARRRSAKRKPRPARPASVPPGGARRAQPGQCQDRGQRAIAARRRGRVGRMEFARRSTASSTTSR